MTLLFIAIELTSVRTHKKSFACQNSPAEVTSSDFQKKM